LIFYQRVSFEKKTMAYSLSFDTQSAVLCWLTEPAFQQLRRKYAEDFNWKTKDELCETTFTTHGQRTMLTNDIAACFARERVRYVMGEKIRMAGQRRRLWEHLCTTYAVLSSHGPETWWIALENPFKLTDWTQVEMKVMCFLRTDEPTVDIPIPVPDESQVSPPPPAEEKFTTQRLGTLLANYAKADDTHRHLVDGLLDLELSIPIEAGKKVVTLFEKVAVDTLDKLVVIDKILKDELPCGLSLADMIVTRNRALTAQEIEVLAGILKIPSWIQSMQPYYGRYCIKAWTNTTPEQKQIAVAFLAAIPGKNAPK
jgi:hypothetical protein